MAHVLLVCHKETFCFPLCVGEWVNRRKLSNCCTLVVTLSPVLLPARGGLILILTEMVSWVVWTSWWKINNNKKNSISRRTDMTCTLFKISRAQRKSRILPGASSLLKVTAQIHVLIYAS